MRSSVRLRDRAGDREFVIACVHVAQRADAWRVDPHRRRRRRDARSTVREALGVCGVRSGKHGGAVCESAAGEAVMHLRRREETEATVMVARVVPVEEMPTEAEPVLLRAEAFGKLRTVLHRLE